MFICVTTETAQGFQTGGEELRESQGLCCSNKREMMEVDMRVRAVFQPSMNDAHVGVRVTLSIMRVNCGLVTVNDGERQRMQCGRLW